MDVTLRPVIVGPTYIRLELDGFTALDGAEKQNKFDVIQLLRKAT